MTEQTLIDDIIAMLRQEEKARADAQQEKLKKFYEALPDMINEVSQQMGIEPAKLVKYAHWAARNYDGVTWTGFISMLRTFYMYKENDEKGMYS